MVRTGNGGDLNMADENGRRCIVTGGATVTFKELSGEAVSCQVLQVLADSGVSHLDIQCGQDYGSPSATSSTSPIHSSN